MVPTPLMRLRLVTISEELVDDELDDDGDAEAKSGAFPVGTGPRSEPPPPIEPPGTERLVVREERNLIGVETSRAHRYSFVAPRTGKRLRKESA